MELDEPLPKLSGTPSPPKPPAKKRIVRRVIRRPARLPEIAKRQATVSYYRKMIKGRLYALAVRLSDASGPEDAPATRDGTVTVQPVVPGALVSPALADISARPGSEVQFMVLPLCRGGLFTGRLPNARVELRSRGKPLESVSLQTKVARRLFLWFQVLLSVLLVGLLAWDRHVGRWEPFFQEAKEQPPPPPLGGRGAGAGGGAGATLPPPPDLSKLAPTEWIPYRGEKAIDRWLEKNAATSQQRVNLENYEVTDAAILALQWVNERKFGGAWSLDGKPRSVFVWAYNGWEVLRNFTMAEVYLAAILLTLIVIVWILTSPSRAVRKSGAFEVTIP